MEKQDNKNRACNPVKAVNRPYSMKLKNMIRGAGYVMDIMPERRQRASLELHYYKPAENAREALKNDWARVGKAIGTVINTQLGPLKTKYTPEEFEEAVRQFKAGNPDLISRFIEFPPEYHRAVTDILNYFREILRKKYPNSKAKVRIEQDGLKVRMVIDLGDGEKEVIEQTMKEYGLVVTGKMGTEEFTDDWMMQTKLRCGIVIPDNRYQIAAGGDICFAKNQAIATINKTVSESDAPDVLKKQLGELTQAVQAMIADMPDHRAKRIADKLAEFSDEVSAPQPDRKWYSLSGEGLIEAAKAVGSLGIPVIKLVKAILDGLPA